MGLRNESWGLGFWCLSLSGVCVWCGVCVVWVGGCGWRGGGGQVDGYAGEWGQFGVTLKMLISKFEMIAAPERGELEFKGRGRPGGIVGLWSCHPARPPAHLPRRAKARPFLPTHEFFVPSS